MMTDVFRALLAKLCEIDPKRFSVNEDAEPNDADWWFQDHYNGFYEHVLHLPQWLFAMLTELKIVELWRLEGLTWEESVLNAIVHHMEKQSRGGQA